MHESTWEPAENVANGPEEIADYYTRVEGNTALKEGDCSVLEVLGTVFDCRVSI